MTSQYAEISDTSNSIRKGDQPFHDWYRFVLSFPPHLVRHYLDEFGHQEDSLVLDPFSGTGTTLVESSLMGVDSIGIEANPVVQFASSTKLKRRVNVKRLRTDAGAIANRVSDIFADEFHMLSLFDSLASDVVTLGGLRQLEPPLKKLLIKDSISPLPEHRALTLLHEIKQQNSKEEDHLILAFIKCLVKDYSNLRFGPEVGVSKKKKSDVDVLTPWQAQVIKMCDDLADIKGLDLGKSISTLGDARDPAASLKGASRKASIVFTSPPYPNEKDYSRATRLETVFLKYATDTLSMRRIKKTLLRSNTRGVYVADTDAEAVSSIKSIQDVAEAIEARRVELGKTSGFERLYPKVTRSYFGGMALHLRRMKPYLAKGCKLGYVVGDQASYLRVMIRTGQLLADVAVQEGYKVEGIDLFRTRFATATKEELREEVLILSV